MGHCSIDEDLHIVDGQGNAVGAHTANSNGQKTSLIRALALQILASYRHVRGRTAMFLTAYIATAVPKRPGWNR
ncbi:Unknown protein sequence [Pseudomonas syringae pv. aceris]|nr:Unknown protein sequence [Pseudomonas syringae pv. aceris]